MSSVALPSESSSPALGDEADLARRAARSDQGAFEELFGRHHQTLWRLAQALTPESDAAATAVSDGLVRALRQIRRRQTDLKADLRPSLLAGVYRAGMDLARKPGQAERDAATVAARRDDAARRAADGGDDAARSALASALAAAAFRSLPERWRAALWLHDVEGLPPDRMAPVLGVSPSVAGALVTRGHRGMAGRFQQAGMDQPPQLGPLLQPVAAAVPAGLLEVAVGRWRKGVVADPAGRYLPATGWLAERAVRPLGIACGSLLAVSVIGMGVLGEHTAVVPTGRVALNQAPAQRGYLGIANPYPSASQLGDANLLLLGQANPYGLGGFGTVGFAPFSGLGGNGLGATLASASSTPPGPAAGAPGTPGAPGAPGSPNPAPSPAPGPLPTGTLPPPPPPPPPPSPPSGGSILTVPGVLNVTTSGATVLPNNKGGGAVVISPSCSSVICSTPGTGATQPAPTTSTTNLLGGVGGLLPKL